MIKRLLILIIICILAAAAWMPDAAASGGVLLRGAANVSTVSPEDLDEYTDEHIVYITKSGEKYHEAGCPHLSESSIPVTLEQALLEDREPCSRCRVVSSGAEPISTAAPETLDDYTDEHIVYITKSGEKYHEAGCSHLSDSSIPVTLEQALLEGREPCSRCHPGINP